MNAKRLMVFLILFWTVCLLCPAQKIREKDLPEKYREWLKLTSYIILPQERDVFMKLTSDRDRDIFIETFWKQRDPTPGTPQNEYKDEHIKRFLYANKYYSRGTTREGWITDMGRMHIILGPPASTERFEGTAGIYPAQVWYYYGDKEKGLPTHFALVFYQREGSGEFKLYNPASDGPASLLIDKKGLDLMDYRTIYEKIRELAPTLAGVAISMIPGQVPYDYQPSPSTNIILVNIFESPKKDVNPAYATHFLNYRGIVSTEYLTNYIESSADTAVIIDPVLNINFLHFSISPKSVSVDYFEPKDQYYCNFELSVSVRKDEEIIFQYTKDFPFYFPYSEMEKVKGSGIAIQDSFPLIEGKFKLDLLVQNSVGKEFSVFEKEIVVPGLSESPKIVGPVLGYGLQDYPGSAHVPFRAVDRKLLFDQQNTFSAADSVAMLFSVNGITESLWNNGKIEILIKGLRKENPVQKSISLELKSYPFRNNLNITYSLRTSELSPDYYEMELNLVDENGKMFDQKSANFIISPSETVPHPTTLVKAFPLSNSFLYFYSLAYQYDKLNQPEKAEANYEKAYLLKPDYRLGVIEYANFLVKNKKFDKSLNMIESIKDDSERRFDYYLIKGRAYAGLGRYPEAIENLLEGNKIYNSDTGLLNTLGFCYYRTGEKKKALDALKASLSLNADQADIKRLIEEIEKK